MMHKAQTAIAFAIANPFSIETCNLNHKKEVKIGAGWNKAAPGFEDTELGAFGAAPPGPVGRRDRDPPPPPNTRHRSISLPVPSAQHSRNRWWASSVEDPKANG